MRALITILAAALTGCATVKEPRPEPMAVPAAWRANVVEGPRVPGGWWHGLGDPELDRLVAEALAQNADIRQAAARVAQGRALVALARAERLPSVGLGAGAERRRFPPLRYPGFDETAPAATITTYSGGIEAAYEIDLFGRLGKDVDSARDQARATEWNARAAQLAVVHDVVRAYAEARAAEARLGTARELVALASAVSATEGRLVRAGLATARAVRESENVHGAAAASIAGLEETHALAVARLALLLDKAPADLALPPARGAAWAVRLEVAPDLPASVIERRPDVQEAWHRLSAATTDVERARLERYPRITLTGALGFSSNDLSAWLVRNALAWALGGGISLPLVDGGRIDARTALAGAVRDEHAAAYRRTVVGALAEVEQALAAWEAAQAREREQAAALARRQRDLHATARMVAGGHADAGRQLRDRIAVLQAEDALVEARLRRVFAYVGVQHVLAR